MKDKLSVFKKLQNRHYFFFNFGSWECLFKAQKQLYLRIVTIEEVNGILHATLPFSHSIIEK